MRWSAGRKLVIGGVEIPHDKGLAGHSDADVLLHAICDALLGAAALGDIGSHFPDTDPQIQRAPTAASCCAPRRRKSPRPATRIVNVDATIVAQAPRMAPHVARMIGNIAADLGLKPAAVSVKATTTEKLGYIGRERRHRGAGDRAHRVEEQRMYLPQHYEETRKEELLASCARIRLARWSSTARAALDANHIPFELHADKGEQGHRHRTWRRTIPSWKEIVDGSEALVIFRGADAYISPNWYPSKHEAQAGADLELPRWCTPTAG